MTNTKFRVHYAERERKLSAVCEARVQDYVLAGWVGTSHSPLFSLGSPSSSSPSSSQTPVIILLDQHGTVLVILKLGHTRSGWLLARRVGRTGCRLRNRYFHSSLITSQCLLFPTRYPIALVLLLTICMEPISLCSSVRCGGIPTFPVLHSGILLCSCSS